MRRAEDDAAYLYDMIDAGEHVVRYVAGKSREDFGGDEVLRDAVERRVEIFGEASRRISRAFQDLHPEIEWRKIASTRHILAHDYDTIDPEVIWRIATVHIPAALPRLRALMPVPPSLEDFDDKEVT